MRENMPERIKVQFRPSLIIFVGEAGKRIRDYLSHDMLLANLDTPLQQSVGLLEITTEGENADPYHADPFPAGEQFPEDEDAPKKGGPLEALIEASLRSVQLDRRRLAISSEDYSVPN